MSNSSSVLLCCHGNVFVHILCHGNKCLLSRCLARMTSASAIIPGFRQCLPRRCLENDHIPTHYESFSIIVFRDINTPDITHEVS
jgi:hypothetical protein